MRDLLRNVKNAIGMGSALDEYEDDDDYADDYDDDSSDYRRSASEQYVDRSKRTSSSNYQSQQYAQSGGKIVPLHVEVGDRKVVVLSPRVYDDARNVCDHLKALSPCVVKLEKLEKEEAQRVVDFIMGACYSMNGHVQEIKDDVFLIAPSTIGIEKEQDEIKMPKSSNSFFSKFSAK